MPVLIRFVAHSTLTFAAVLSVAMGFGVCTRGVVLADDFTIDQGKNVTEDSEDKSAPFVTEYDHCKVIRSVEYAQYSAGEDSEAAQKSLLADVYLPQEPGPFPTILMVHGGAWFAGSKADVSSHARHAANLGYAVVAINYRLAPTYKFPAQLDDCRSALRWINDNAERYSFDVNRIAAYGYSAGAHLVCLLGVTQNCNADVSADIESGGTKTADLRSSESDPIHHEVDAMKLPIVKAIVAGGAPCEFSWIPLQSERLAFWLGGSREKLPKRYSDASPTSFVDDADPPTFFFHGTTDRIVPLSSAEKMNSLLEQQGVHSILHIVPDASHFGAFINRNARKLAIQFLDEQLNSATGK